MPRSKRDQKVSLTKTVKKGLIFRHQLAKEIKSCAEKYSCAFTFAVQNMRNEKMKELRSEWKHSRFFFGKNKVMAFGLGKDPRLEARKNIHKLARQLKGQCGLLFTNKPKDEVLDWFNNYHESGFARSGAEATETVRLPEGPCPQLLPSMEPVYRRMGLPFKIKRGEVKLLEDYTVCKKGDILTPEQSRMLKFLDTPMADFRLILGCVWTSDGKFQILNRWNMMKRTPGVLKDTEPEKMDMDDKSAGSNGESSKSDDESSGSDDESSGSDDKSSGSKMESSGNSGESSGSSDESSGSSDESSGSDDDSKSDD